MKCLFVDGRRQRKQPVHQIGSRPDVRKQFGWTSYQLLTEVGDSNHVTIVARIRSAAQAKDFGKSSSLKEAMQKGGVQGPPDVTLLKVVEDKRY
jgi:heme-degrading monooxygenase HmoA